MFFQKRSLAIATGGNHPSTPFRRNIKPPLPHETIKEQDSSGSANLLKTDGPNLKLLIEL